MHRLNHVLFSSSPTPLTPSLQSVPSLHSVAYVLQLARRIPACTVQLTRTCKAYLYTKPSAAHSIPIQIRRQGNRMAHNFVSQAYFFYLQILLQILDDIMMHLSIHTPATDIRILPLDHQISLVTRTHPLAAILHHTFSTPHYILPPNNSLLRWFNLQYISRNSAQGRNLESI